MDGGQGQREHLFDRLGGESELSIAPGGEVVSFHDPIQGVVGRDLGSDLTWSLAPPVSVWWRPAP